MPNFEIDATTLNIQRRKSSDGTPSHLTLAIGDETGATATIRIPNDLWVEKSAAVVQDAVDGAMREIEHSAEDFRAKAADSIEMFNDAVKNVVRTVRREFEAKAQRAVNHTLTFEPTVAAPPQ